MVRGGIATRLIRFAAGLVGHMRGGLGQVNVVASTLFGGISGSAVADASAVGGLMIPQMAARGYDRDYAVNVTANAAIIALMIPPSHNMILYSIAAGGNVSVADLFTAGIIPGILLAGALMFTAWWVAVKRGYPADAFPGFSRVGYYFLASLPGILLIAIIFGGVRSGVFTATESSCIAVLYAFLVAMLVYRELNWEGFVEAVMGAVRTTAMVLLVIGTAASFGWLMAFLQVQTLIIAAISAISDNPIIVLLMINIILLVLGTFMDMAPMVIIATPILLPVVKAFGIDPVHFGVVMILNAGIGLNTPPVGTVLFVSCAVGGITIREAMRTIWPFFGASIFVLLLVTYIPALSLWLPAVFR
jgi:tripartite ATP-independent transporter DctM subunit